jgi:hypothetical protein
MSGHFLLLCVCVCVCVRERERETYSLLEEAYTTLTHNEAVDAWSLQIPEIWNN